MSGAPMSGLGMIELALLLLLPVFFTPWLIALVDILRSEFTENNKLIWLLTVVFVPVVGWLTYFAIGRSQKRQPAQP
jgi:heme/copper-type cytochrome/quinol oxidase subunit 2